MEAGLHVRATDRRNAGALAALRRQRRRRSRDRESRQHVSSLGCVAVSLLSEEKRFPKRANRTSTTRDTQPAHADRFVRSTRVALPRTRNPAPPRRTQLGKTVRSAAPLGIRTGPCKPTDANAMLQNAFDKRMGTPSLLELCEYPAHCAESSALLPPGAPVAREDEKELGVSDQVSPPKATGFASEAIAPLEARPRHPPGGARHLSGDEVQ